jgi:hypothetical protein
MVVSAGDSRNANNSAVSATYDEASRQIKPQWFASHKFQLQTGAAKKSVDQGQINNFYATTIYNK